MAKKDKETPKLKLVTTAPKPQGRTPRGPKPLEFVTAIERVIDGETVHLVNARELHRFLGSGQHFDGWLTGRCAALGLEEGKDLLPLDAGLIHKPMENSDEGQEAAGATARKPGRPRTRDRLMPIDVAKAVAMAEQTERGKMVRAYFIEIEKRYHLGVQERLRHSLEAETREALRQNEESHALRMAQAIERVRQETKAASAEADRRINGIIVAEVERRLELERQELRNRAMLRREHYRLTSLGRYYRSLGVDARTAMELTTAALTCLMAGGLRAMMPVDEDALTHEALFALDDIERWRHEQGYLIEREMGVSIRPPSFGHPV